jgi:hypothetical protein
MEKEKIVKHSNCAASRRLGLRKTAVGLRLLCGFSPPHFCKPLKPTVFFIATAKTSYTAGTLYEMEVNLIEIYKKA